MSWDNVTQGLPDEAFIRGTIPMTKCEVRTISLAKLQLKKNSTVLDIGCGTGSISVECGLLCPEGHITAIDQNEEAIALTQENAAHFKVKNISVIHGKAPEELPKQSFDRIFLGGGSRVIDPIITYVKAYLKPEGLFVANTILLESTFKLLTALENEGFKEITCINIQVSRGVQELGWMMKALNPIYMITAVNPKERIKLMAKFYGIGVGPGDPELLTIKATRILSIIDVLLIPQTQKDEKGIAFTIMEPYLKEGIELVYIDFPMVVDEAVFNQAGEEASLVIQDRIQKNQNCAFVTLGDPSVYSTYGYIVKALKNSVTIETIPGITSFCAAAALANRPLVEKDELLTIIPMNASDEKIDAVLKVSNAFTFMKIYRREGRVIQHLKKYHMEADGVLVQRCGFPEAKVHTNVINSLEENKDYLTVVLSRKEEIK